MDVELKDMTRDELNKFAADNYSGVIPDAEAYPNKDDLLEAVEAAVAGDPVPEPKVKSSSKSGKTVTFTGHETENVRSVRVGDHRFVLNTPVEGVDTETVKALDELEGHNFDVS